MISPYWKISLACVLILFVLGLQNPLFGDAACVSKRFREWGCALFLFISFPVFSAAQDSSPPIIWQPWSDRIFEQASREHKFVLLNFETAWSHWCHVMDDQTYNDPDVRPIGPSLAGRQSSPRMATASICCRSIPSYIERSGSQKIRKTAKASQDAKIKNPFHLLVNTAGPTDFDTPPAGSKLTMNFVTEFTG